MSVIVDIVEMGWEDWAMWFDALLLGFLEIEGG
jgi:hypothetical protein